MKHLVSVSTYIKYPSNSKPVEITFLITDREVENLSFRHLEDLAVEAGFKLKDKDLKYLKEQSNAGSTTIGLRGETNLRFTIKSVYVKK